MRTFPQFSYHFCPFYNASVLTERLRFAILKAVQMSGDHRHQRPLTSLEKQDSWLSGLLYHVIFFSDIYIIPATKCQYYLSNSYALPLIKYLTFPCKNHRKRLY